MKGHDCRNRHEAESIQRPIPLRIPLTGGSTAVIGFRIVTGNFGERRARRNRNPLSL